MKLDEIINTLSHSDPTELPVDALFAARERWAEFLPVIEGLIQRFIATEDLSEAEENVVFFGVNLIADRKQHSCFDMLVHLTDRQDVGFPLDELLGDYISWGLPTAYYILAQGRHEQLCYLINSEHAGEIIKMSVMSTLFSQLYTEQIDRDTLDTHIQTFINSLVANEQFMALTALANQLISFQFNHYHQQFIELVNSKVIDEGPIENKCIIDWDNGCIGDSEWDCGLVSDSYDAIERLGEWAGGDGEDELSDEELMEIFGDLNNPLNGLDSMGSDFFVKNYSFSLPYIAETKVGRNEPCPCGSGKKYKKCCMN